MSFSFLPHRRRKEYVGVVFRQKHANLHNIALLICFEKVLEIQVLVLIPPTVVRGGFFGFAQLRIGLLKVHVIVLLEKVHHALEIVIRDLELARGRHCICKLAQCASMSHLDILNATASGMSSRDAIRPRPAAHATAPGAFAELVRVSTMRFNVTPGYP